MPGRRRQEAESGRATQHARRWRVASRCLASPLAVVSLIWFGGAAASAQEAPPQEPLAEDPRQGLASLTEAEAERTLEEAEEILAGDAEAAPTGRELTVALRDLALALPALRGSERREARAILVRPTDGAGDPLGDGYAVDEETPVCSAGFCVHYVAATNDAPSLVDVSPANGIPDYVERVLEAAEASYSVANGLLGWTEPRSDGSRGGNSKTDVYLKNISSQGLFGYAAPDPSQGLVRKQYAYLVIDNDYSAAEFPGYATPLDPMRVTIAHEYNHVLQFAYDSFQDTWLFESTATWMEEQVFPAIDDYVDGFVAEFARRPHVPLTDPRTRKIYGDAVWQHFLSSRFDHAVTRDAWASSTKTRPKDFAVGAFDHVLDGRGTSFSRQFARFAAATAEWRATSVFPDTYPDVKRSGALRPGRARTAKLDHTAYRLYDLTGSAKGRGASSGDLKLVVRAAGRTRSGLALVARRGSPTGGTVKTKVKFLERGGRGVVKLRRFGRYDRITAVVVNADGRVDGFSGNDWAYRKDDVRYRLKLKRG